MRADRWTWVHPGVYATFTGPLSDLARVWAALLYAGPTAVASHDTAAWLWELRADLPTRLTIAVPHGRRILGLPTVYVVQCRRLPGRRPGVRTPPRTTVEDTVLDLVDRARVERPVIDIVLRACQQRLTTPARLSAAARTRPRLRWRALVHALLTEAEDGVASPLERWYLRNIERPHGLPRGTRNRPEGRAGRRRCRDVRYRKWRLVVELDGRAAHPEDEREDDDLRDNEVLERRERTLRYGWRSATGRPCHVAGQVGRLLRQGGWPGRPTPCGPQCALHQSSE